jgi:hypothetical protein
VSDTIPELPDPLSPSNQRHSTPPHSQVITRYASEAGVSLYRPCTQQYPSMPDGLCCRRGCPAESSRSISVAVARLPCVFTMMSVLIRSTICSGETVVFCKYPSYTNQSQATLKSALPKFTGHSNPTLAKVSNGTFELDISLSSGPAFSVSVR